MLHYLAGCVCWGYCYNNDVSLYWLPWLWQSQLQLISWLRMWKEPYFLSQWTYCGLIGSSLITRFMGPIWGRQNPGGPHVGPMNLAFWIVTTHYRVWSLYWIIMKHSLYLNFWRLRFWMFLISSCGCLCPSYWCQVLSREWRCSWSSADRRCSNYIWVINNFINRQCATYIRDLMVCLKWGLGCLDTSLHKKIILYWSSNPILSIIFNWLIWFLIWKLIYRIIKYQRNLQKSYVALLSSLWLWQTQWWPNFMTS